MKKNEKLKHLEFLQSVINRMAHNSFLLKGWSITIIVGLFALADKDKNSIYMLLAYIPALLFWLLDGYYLAQERLFRALYNDCITPKTKVKNFSMDTSLYKNGRNTWFKAVFSRTLVLFYSPLLLALAAICVCLLFNWKLFP